MRLTPREVLVTNHPAFQRLGEINQLGQTYLVYRGATHRRLEHSLGTLHVAQMMVEALDRNLRAKVAPEDIGTHWKRDEPLRPHEVAFLRLGALLHDLGHLPAGHTFEDELGLFAKHDSVKRLNFILNRRQWWNLESEPLGDLIDRLYRPLVNETGFRGKPRELLLALVASDAGRLKDTEEFRFGVCRDLIGNTICADLLDYLHRDWHHLGKGKQFDTRLIDYLEIRRDGQGGPSVLVVYLRGKDRVRHDAVSAILDLLESRYQLYEIALYHRTKLSAAAMLERSVAELSDARGQKWLEALPDRLLDCSDSEMITMLHQQAVEAAGRGNTEKKARIAGAAESLAALRGRRLHKKLYQRVRTQFTMPQARRVAELYAHAPGDDTQRQPGKHRLQALRELEHDFQLMPCSLAMYCPPAGMSTKVAQVKILVDEELRSLDEHEKVDERLTGGHLSAQTRRFHNLWHVFFSCEEQALEDIRKRGLHPLLIDAIDCFVLGLDQGPVTPEERALTIAHSLAMSHGSPWEGRAVVDSLATAHRGNQVTHYPIGLPAIRHLLQ